MAEHQGSVGHETKDVDIKKIALSGVVFFVVAFGALYVARPLYRALAKVSTSPTMRTTPEPDVRAPAIINPHTDLAAASGEQLRALRAEEDLVLDHYRWIDKKQKTVRLPIGRAMELVVQRGLPSREEAPTNEKLIMGESNGYSEGGVP
jgi:hypothetical protein